MTSQRISWSSLISNWRHLFHQNRIPSVSDLSWYGALKSQPESTTNSRRFFLYFSYGYLVGFLARIRTITFLKKNTIISWKASMSTSAGTPNRIRSHLVSTAWSSLLWSSTFPLLCGMTLSSEIYQSQQILRFIVRSHQNVITEPFSTAIFQTDYLEVTWNVIPFWPASQEFMEVGWKVLKVVSLNSFVVRWLLEELPMCLFVFINTLLLINYCLDDYFEKSEVKMEVCGSNTEHTFVLYVWPQLTPPTTHSCGVSAYMPNCCCQRTYYPALAQCLSWLFP